MALSMAVNVSVREGFESPLASKVSFAPDHIHKLHETIPAGVAEFLVDLAFGYSYLSVLYLVCSGGDLVVDFMSGTSSIAQVNLTAGYPWLWFDGSGDNPLVDDVDYLYVENPGSDDVILQGRISWDNPPV